MAAEGSYRHDGSIMVSQSHEANPYYVMYLDELLLGDRCVYSRTTHKGMTNWRITKELSQQLKTVMPNKYPECSFIMSMTNAQRRLFLYEFMRADGDGRERGEYGPMPTTRKIVRARDMFRGKTTPRICVASHALCESLQIIATMCGLPSGLKEGRNLWRLSLYRRRRVVWICNMTKEETTADGCWCPTTTHGTFIARRNGRVFLTGNSHVHDALQYDMVKLFRAKKPRDEYAMLRRKREQEMRKPGKRTGY